MGAKKRLNRTKKSEFMFCPYCGGSGVDPETMDDCPDCKGKGKVKRSLNLKKKKRTKESE